MADSFRRWTGRPLIDSSDDLAHALYHAPFVLASHGTEPDPILRYANLTAQKLWQMDWDDITRLPSRFTAEPDAREERERLLALAEKQGYLDNYCGIRVTSQGRRFRIRDCVLWNVIDEHGARIG